MNREKRGENETIQPLKLSTIFQELSLNFKQPYLDIFDSKDNSNKMQNDLENNSKQNNTLMEENDHPILSSEDEDDDTDILSQTELDCMMNSTRRTTQRIGISAEVYGANNRKSDFIPKFFKKTEDEKKKLLTNFEKIFLFSSLNQKDKDALADAAQKKEFKKGDKIISQGEEGDYYYILLSGSVECFHKAKNTEKEQFLRNYTEGDSFGELALLYNCPRLASIKATSNCVLFALDRFTFNHIVKDSANRKRIKFEEIFREVEIMKKLDTYELGQVIDAIKEKDFKTGEFIISQNTEGNEFYFLIEGKAFASKNDSKTGKTEKTMNYKEGDYFGELASIKNELRAASVIAEVKLFFNQDKCEDWIFR